MKPPSPFKVILPSILPLAVLSIILAYTYAWFFQVPYVGFDFNPSTGEVIAIFEQGQPGSTLEKGDRILRINSLDWSEFRADTRHPLFVGLQSGQLISLTIQRDGQVVVLPWVIPGPKDAETFDRVINLWYIPYVFWLAGTATLLLLRPRDIRWRLFVSFYYLTAIWLSGGNISRWQIWESAILYRSVIWLCLPVYLHLHWVFPMPLGPLPKWITRVGYLLGATLALMEWFHLLARDAFYLGFFLAISGSLILLIFHFIRQPLQRRVLGLVASAFGLIIIPSAGLSIAGMFSNLPAMGGGALFALPVIPVAYFYVIYQRQLGGLEIQANRLISIYLFSILLGTLFIILIALSNSWFDFPGSAFFTPALCVVLSSVVTALGFSPFRQFVERHLMGITHSPERLVGTYAARITTNLEMSTLIDLLKDEVLPSLLVRQFALVSIDEDNQVQPLLVVGGPDLHLPGQSEIPDLLNRANKYRPIPQVPDPNSDLSWDRLVLPLEANGKLIGFWLLGERSPDDFYAQSELPTLQTLANQTAIALTNIAQSAQLHALYQTDIERYERERTKLAHDLHDDVLNRLIILKMYADHDAEQAQFKEAYSELIEHTRQTISGLRPPMLDYGLQVALEEMVDEMCERPDCEGRIEYAVISSGARYDPSVEQHLYRIVQQACENAIRHARAQRICLHGRLETDLIHLVVEDDGISFDIKEHLNITDLLSKGHFGLVGMLERARLIGARIEIFPAHSSGTQVVIDWNSPDPA